MSRAFSLSCANVFMSRLCSTIRVWRAATARCWQPAAAEVPQVRVWVQAAQVRWQFQ